MHLLAFIHPLYFSDFLLNIMSERDLELGYDPDDWVTLVF